MGDEQPPKAKPAAEVIDLEKMRGAQEFMRAADRVIAFGDGPVSTLLEKLRTGELTGPEAARATSRAVKQTYKALRAVYSAHMGISDEEWERARQAYSAARWRELEKEDKERGS